MKDAIQDSAAPEKKLPSAQLEKLALECEKLRAELGATNSPKSFADKLAQHGAWLSMLLAVTGFVFGVYQYRNEQVQNREAAKEQSERDQDARDRDFMKPLWEKQLELYFKASEAAATIATTATNSADRFRAEQTFWTLYEGPLVLVESPEVTQAMVAFGDRLRGKTAGDLRDLSRKLASAFQASLTNASNLRLIDFSKGKYDYRAR